MILPVPYDKLPAYITDIFAALGISPKNTILLVQEARRFEHLVVPQPAYYFNHYITEAFKECFDYAGDRLYSKEIPVYKKVYLGREHLSKGGVGGIGYENGKMLRMEFGEKSIRKQFERNGFKILFPEEMTISEQVSVFRNADVIACGNGSIAHNVIWTKKKTKLIQLERYNSHNDGDGDINQSFINIVSPIAFDTINCYQKKSTRNENCMLLTKGFKAYMKNSGYRISITPDILVETIISLIRFYICKMRRKVTYIMRRG